MIVNTTLAVPPAKRVTVFGFRESVGLDPLLGVMEVVRLIIPPNPPILVNVMALDPVDPRVIFSAIGFASIVKSGGGETVTTRNAVTL